MPLENTEPKLNALTIMLLRSTTPLAAMDEQETELSCWEGPAAQFVIHFNSSGDMATFIAAFSKIIPRNTLLDM